MFQVLIFAVISLFSLINPHSTFAQTTKAWKDQDTRCVGGQIYSVDTSDVATIQGFECLFFNILQVIVYIVGITFLIMFIYGGFNYLFSDNDSKKTAVASSTLTMAVMGVVGIIAAWYILKLISNFTGINNITDFKLPG
jgi:hypothetical protein